jgi:outer membrane protein assembly factor BamB
MATRGFITRRAVFCVAALALAAGSLFSADWPQWRGPNRDSVYNDRLTLNWPPKVLWRKADIGKSLSGIVVADGTLILHYRQDGQEVVRALDASSGNDLWKQAYDQPLPDEAGRGYGNWPRSTPAITGGLVYTLGYAGKLYATELKTGKVAWNVDTFAEFKHNKQNVQALNFGVTASPLVAGGKVFIPQGTWAKWRMVALDAKSGAVAWTALENRQPSYSASYSSPMPFRIGKMDLVACDGCIFSPADGTVYSRRLAGGIATPVVSEDVMVQSCGPVNNETTPYTLAYKLAVKDDKAEASRLWKNEVLGRCDSTAVVYQGHLYAQVSDLAKPSPKGLKCVELATGKEVWCEKKSYDDYYGAIILVGDKLLVLMENGELTLVDASPAGYNERGRMKVAGKTMSHPALANGRLYVRDDKELVCLDMSEK